MTPIGIARIVRQTLACLRLGGPATAWAFLSDNLRRKLGSTRPRTYHLHPRGLAHPLLLRGGRGDLFVFAQIFADREFAPLRQQNFSRIVDLGGNIGLASAWFLNAFPRAKVVTIEANPDNYASLEANLQPYGDRATVVQGGVWWRRAPLALVRRQNESDAHVREALPEDASAEILEGWDVPALMELGGFPEIDLLKIDIEGAEVELFSRGTERWLPQIRNLSIELHGPECEAAFDRALASYTCRRQLRGELTFCLDLRPKDLRPIDPSSAAAPAHERPLQVRTI
jgi:FkbM family methyltransferase